VVSARAAVTPESPPGSSDLDFPLRVASVDIGSNAIRLLAAEFADPGHWISLESRRAPVRLRHSAYLTGRLEPVKIDMALEALLGFREIMDSLAIREHRVVATSAVRESRNRGDLIERAWEVAGFRIETISGSEEARLVWLAIRHRIDLVGRWLMVDLGGGSLEVSVVARNGVEWTESHAVGTVRLLDELDSGHGNASGKLARLVDQYLGGLRLPNLGGELAGLIATGGNIEELAQLAGAVPEANGSFRRYQEMIGAELELLRDRFGFDVIDADDRLADIQQQLRSAAERALNNAYASPSATLQPRIPLSPPVWMNLEVS
jgi:exopolyphosphatase / guanosine-5'-triphosphate,3'-diphosphate pyrophosphatase